MGIETTIYTPRTLGKLVRRMPPVHTFFRDTFFKNRRTFNTKSVDVDFKKGVPRPCALCSSESGRENHPKHGLSDEELHPRSAGPEQDHHR